MFCFINIQGEKGEVEIFVTQSRRIDKKRAVGKEGVCKCTVNIDRHSSPSFLVK